MATRPTTASPWLESRRSRTLSHIEKTSNLVAVEMTRDQIIRGFRTDFPVVSPTDEESARFVSESDVEQMLAQLTKSGYPDLGKVCYISGSGGQPRCVYRDMKREPGVRVVSYRSVFPPLWFLPSYGGLVRIDDPSKLYVVFDQVVSQSMAVVYIFDASLEASFLEAAVKRENEHGDCSFVVKRDPGYLIYLVDEDRDDSPTGAVEFLSYDRSGPWKSELLKGRFC
jgi:hypothetical protein